MSQSKLQRPPVDVMAFAYTRPPPPPTMPPGLRELMEELTREVLRCGPADVNEFCANHMKKLLEIRDGPPKMRTLTLEEKIARAQSAVRQRAYQRIKKIEESVSSNEDICEDSSQAENLISESSKAPVHKENYLKEGLELELFPENDAIFEPPVFMKHAEPMSVALEKVSDIKQSLSKNEQKELYVSEVKEVGNEDGYENETQNVAQREVKKYEVVAEKSKVELIEIDQIPELSKLPDLETKVLPDSVDVDVQDDKQMFDPDIIKPAEGVKHVIAVEPQNNIHVEDEAFDGIARQVLEPKNEIEEPINQYTENNDNVIVQSNMRNESEQIHSPIENEHLSEEIQPSKDSMVTEESQELKIIHEQEPSNANADILKSEDEETREIDSTTNIQAESDLTEELLSVKSRGYSEGATENLGTDCQTNISSPEKLNGPNNHNHNHFEQEINNESEVQMTDSSQINNQKIDVNNSQEEYSKSQEIIDSTNSELEVTSVNKNVILKQNIETDLLAKKDKKDLVTETTGLDLNLPKVVSPELIAQIPIREMEDGRNLEVGNDSNDEDKIQNEKENESKVEKVSEDTKEDESLKDKKIPEVEIAKTEQNNITQDLAESTNAEDPIIEHVPEDINVKDESVKTDSYKDESHLMDQVLASASHIPDEVSSNDGTTQDISSSDEIQQIGNTHMDLETAAVTIQKVFRSFLFKSRNSTFDDAASDESVNVDKEGMKEEDSVFLSHHENKDRRTLGLSRMDSVLQTVNEEKSLSLSTDDSSTLSSAATTIQAHVRGFLVRNKLSSTKTTSTNSLGNSNPSESTDLPEPTKTKTVLNIHIVPESSHYVSRDDSILASMDLSMDGSPPTSTNLHPLSYDIAEKRKQLKREDAIQSVSPPSNNSGKLSEDVDSAKEMLNDVGTITQHSTDETLVNKTVDSKQNTGSHETTPTLSITEDTVKTAIEMKNDRDETEEKKNTSVKGHLDEMDVVTPFQEDCTSGSGDSKLLHTGEFHDAVLPTKVSRNDSVIREFKNVLVYFLLWK